MSWITEISNNSVAVEMAYSNAFAAAVCVYRPFFSASSSGLLCVYSVVRKGGSHVLFFVIDLSL